MKAVATFQGCSELTERKEFEIEGVSAMRTNMFKSPFFHNTYKHVVFADVFCGTGKNAVNDKIVDGSPIRLLSGFSGAKNNQRLPYQFSFWFSDIRKDACAALQRRIEEKFDLSAWVQPCSAVNAINDLGNILNANKEIFLFLILDPNGPTDFPKLETEHLLSSFSKRIDVIPYISATSINRCIGARNKALRDFKGWLGEIENFNEGFVASLVQNGRRGWIRKPIDGDRQRWTMIPTFGQLKPRNDWSKQGYVDIESKEGQEIIKFYCGGNQ